jgi:GAF domain-containing protein
MASDLLSELEQMAAAVDQEGVTVENSLLAVGGKIAKELGVKADEVAILAVSAKRRHLHFLVPQPLKDVGSIPLTSHSALAARTARESRPEINNDFSGVRHATVFEGVRTAMTSGESIQKIISAPILYEGKVVGVMQISRKGTSTATSGPDFSAEDLGKVLALCRPLGRLVQHFGGE